MNQSILVVDDSADSQALVRILLEQEGFVVHSALDPPRALAILETVRPDLILMDLQLPGMDGLELTRRLRNNPLLQGVVILAFSAYATDTDEEESRRAGCQGYIRKPIDTRTFTSILRQHLAAKPG
jgi:two-component system, cell cycle response regulator DivK